MIAVIIVHFGDAGLTSRCLASVLADAQDPISILVVDNGGGEPESFAQLKARYSDHARVVFRGDGVNRGFAVACEQAFEDLFSVREVDAVLLLNNDCEVDPGFLKAMSAGLDLSSRTDMVAAHMVVWAQPDEVDSLGITLYSCGIAANRLTEGEPLLGPCGGAALYSMRMLRDLRERTGQCFESRFFCYAEDTDLSIRARLLGYRAAYAPAATVRHVGSAASGGSESDFVMYHGLRNSLSTLLRCVPAGFFLRFGLKLLLLQFMLAVKYIRTGRFGLLLRIWRDVLGDAPGSLKMRRRLRKAGVLRWRTIAHVIDRHFYQRGYLMEQARSLMRASTGKTRT